MQMAVFQDFCQLAYEGAGIRLRPGKEALVAARVGHRMRVLGLSSAHAYLARLRADSSGQELVHFLDAISTNVTAFFREPAHFDALGEAVRSWIDQGRRQVRIWCAAAATGEEAYSIAMVVLDRLGGRSLDFRVLATDLSTRALSVAAAGEYGLDGVKPISRSRLRRYFRHSVNPVSRTPVVTVAPEVRQRVVFRRLNLSQIPFPMRGPFDVVFCRNVMIYFDRPVRQRLVGEVERLLRPGGTLMTGHSETLTGLETRLRPCQSAVYRLEEELR